MRLNEIFYSLQGEGFYTGTPSVFIRFSGCNLKCPFCDTKHQNFTEMSEDEIVEEISQYPAQHIVITGGEPSLQLTESFVALLHDNGKFVCVETNGTNVLPPNVDWITLSPKKHFVKSQNADIVIRHCNELKVVFDGTNLPIYLEELNADHFFLQPCHTNDERKNKHILKQTIDYCLQHPKWRLSLQTQNIIGVK